MDYNIQPTLFNLQTSIDPTNMASTSRFKLRPAPIVLQRVPSTTPHSLEVQSQGVLPFEQRMELATRLAQREIEMKTSLQSKAAHSCDCKGAGEGVESTQEPHPSPCKKPPLSLTKKKTRVKPNIKQPHKVTSNRTSCIDSTGGGDHHGVTEHKGTSVEVQNEGEKIESEIEATAREIVKLRKDLTRNMQRLKLLSLKADLESTPSDVHQPMGPSLSVEGRMGWIEDKTHKKKQVKAHGQAVRNARLIYQLQQNVREAQRQLQAPKTNSKTRLLAMHRLASAHRTAIRTLHHLASVGVSGGGVTHKSSHDEVAVLIDQLSRLCVDAHVGGADSEDHMSSLMKELTDYHSHVKQLLHTSRNTVPNSPAVMAAKRLLSPKIVNERRKGAYHSKYKPKGVLLNPMLRVKRPLGLTTMNPKPFTKRKAKQISHTVTTEPGHMTLHGPRPLHEPSHNPHLSPSCGPHPINERPHNSHLSPPQVHGPRPLHELLPESHSLHKPHLSSSHGPHHKSHGTTHDDSPPLGSHCLSPVNEAESNEPKEVAHLPWEQPGQNMEEREIARQMWLDKRALDIAEDLEKAAKQYESQQKESINEDPSDENCLDNEKEEAEADRRHEGDMDSKQPTTAELSSVQMQEFEKMIKRIEEIERERIDLQTKWQNVNHECMNEDDTRPNVCKDLDPHIISPSCSDGIPPLDPSLFFKNPTVHAWVPDNNPRPSDTIIRPSDTITRPSDSCTRPSDTVSSTVLNPVVLQNGELPVTDFRINRVPNRKQLLIESIADDILKDLIKTTSLELSDVIHTCVKHLYDNEFHSPPTHS